MLLQFFLRLWSLKQVQDEPNGYLAALYNFVDLMAGLCSPMDLCAVLCSPEDVEDGDVDVGGGQRGGRQHKAREKAS